ncbi:hypothetical protein K439DRAFT_1281613, partial [Ramaria rubella]
LVTDRLITSLELNLGSGTKTCDSCVYAKSMRKAVPKEQSSERAKEIGGEVNSNLWGPAPVKTKGGRAYFATFTDDKS